MFKWILFVIALLFLVRNVTEGYSDTANSYDIIIVAGQSNSVGYSYEGDINYPNGVPYGQNNALFLPDELTPIPNVFILERDPAWPLRYERTVMMFNQPHLANGTGIFPSIEPMSYNSTSYNPRPSITFYRTFAKNYATANPGRKVLIIQNGFEDCALCRDKTNHEFIKFPISWNTNNYLYKTLIRRVNRVKSWNSNNRVVAVLWSQGEGDIDSSIPVATYKTALTNFVNTLRTALGSQVPFLACGYAKEWHASDSFTALRNQYMSNLQSMSCTTYTGENQGTGTVRSGAGIIPKFGYVSTMGGTVQVTGNIANNNPVHFSFAGLRELGQRFWRVYNVIK